ncbi:MAG: peptidoglycan DL-endopeptidase CwlO [Actinomycetota bacterium]|nr:peptidoglycan DL-endopeptidase CwlO [Actinomycetota bacterium]
MLLAVLTVGLIWATYPVHDRSVRVAAVVAVPVNHAAQIAAPPVPLAAPVVVPAIPPMPPHKSATDAPALTAHAAAMSVDLNAATAAADKAAVRVAELQVDVTSSKRRLAAIADRAQAVGAPVPVTPPMPSPPPIKTTDGELLSLGDAEMSQPGAASPRVMPATRWDRTIENAADVTAGGAATSPRQAQLDVNEAQLALVGSMADTQAQQWRAAALRQELVFTMQALATLPSPDPRSSFGCPSLPLADTLRGGSATVGLAKLCADSVAAAPTPEAALAIKWALASLGLPYSQELRNDPGWADCSSFVSRAYTAAGVPLAPPGVNAPTTDSMRVESWAVMEPATALLPGDLIEPEPGHVVMALADGYMVHTNATGDVAHVSVMYTDPWLVLRVDPLAVGKSPHPDPQTTGAVPDLSSSGVPAPPVPIPSDAPARPFFNSLLIPVTHTVPLTVTAPSASSVPAGTPPGFWPPTSPGLPVSSSAGPPTSGSAVPTSTDSPTPSVTPSPSAAGSQVPSPSPTPPAAPPPTDTAPPAPSAPASAVNTVPPVASSTAPAPTPAPPPASVPASAPAPPSPTDSPTPVVS